MRDVGLLGPLARHGGPFVPNRLGARVRVDLGLRRGLFHRLLCVRRGSATDALVLATILLPIVAGALLFALPRRRSRCSVAAIGVARRGRDVRAGRCGRPRRVEPRWLSRPFESRRSISARRRSRSGSRCCSRSAPHARSPRRGPARARLHRADAVARRRDAGLFLARDLLVFALFWDLMLLPVFFALLGWGEHPATAWRYFIYNFAGGLTLLARDGGVRRHLRSDRRHRARRRRHLVGAWAPWIFAGFAFAFLVKTPVWPLHTWMPPTYADLPAPMVAVVSAVQSKAGLYGFIAIGLAFMPDYVRAVRGPSDRSGRDFAGLRRGRSRSCRTTPSVSSRIRRSRISV